ncbi:MAG: LicD family protein [Magnetococcales bacterium]|nr:LicD family protein [Magnetococcales bacterium]
MDLDTLFPDLRETGETPNRQCQLVMIRMLRILDHLTRKHGILYWLDFGAVIGALRENGRMLPWDSDIDVGMFQKDYVRFVDKVVPELPPGIFFQSPETDPDFPLWSPRFPIFKLRDRYSTYLTCDVPVPWQDGMQVDIFVYPDPSRCFLCARLKNYLILIRKMITRSKRADCWGHYYALGDVFPLKSVLFEGHTYPVPNRYDWFLRFYFGDYMVPPDPKEIPKGTFGDPCNAGPHKESRAWQKRSQPQ